ncbi:17072_t:CDS:2, partial [Gigaspora rosea]
MDGNDILESFEEQLLDITTCEENLDEIVDTNDQNLDKRIDAPKIGQIFNNWDKLDCYITLYAKSQNFVSVKRSSEYDNSVVNWKVNPANNSLISLFWISPDQHDLYVRYQDVIQHNNTYSTNQFKMSLGFFVIVDNNNQSRLVEQVLINDETAEVFTAGMQSTQRVGGQIAIIKNSVNGNTSLINISKHIYEQISHASTFIQYKNWIHSIKGSTLTYASLEFSTDIDRWIFTYQTPTSLSMQWQEIAQLLILLLIDTPSILLKELILPTEVESVLEVWEITWKNIKQHEDKDEATSDSSSSDDDFVSVEDPVVHPKRGAPKKKRIKGSHEFANTNKSKQSLEVRKNRKPTQYQQCQNTGHNKASCEAWHKWE